MDPPLHKLLVTNLGIESHLYTFRWFTTLFAREFMLPDVIRIWDTLFADTERKVFVLYFGVAMLMMIKDLLMNGDFTENLTLLQSYPPDVNVIDIIKLAQALRTKDRCDPNGKTNEKSMPYFSPSKSKRPSLSYLASSISSAMPSFSANSSNTFSWKEKEPIVSTKGINNSLAENTMASEVIDTNAAVVSNADAVANIVNPSSVRASFTSAKVAFAGFLKSNAVSENENSKPSETLSLPSTSNSSVFKASISKLWQSMSTNATKAVQSDVETVTIDTDTIPTAVAEQSQSAHVESVIVEAMNDSVIIEG